MTDQTVMTVKDGTHLADVGHLSWPVGVLHVLEERRFVSKRQFADLTLAWGGTIMDGCTI